ncbi:hypothetical protein ACQJBY_054554 [Aegilops geniculata]
MCCNLSNVCVYCSLCMHSRDVFSPIPWHQGGRVRREQQYMVVGFNFLPPRCFHSVMQGCSVQFINFIQFGEVEIGARWGVAVCVEAARRNVTDRILLFSPELKHVGKPGVGPTTVVCLPPSPCREVTQLRADLEAPSPRRHNCRTNVLLTAQAFSRSSCPTILKGKME